MALLGLKGKDRDAKSQHLTMPPKNKERLVASDGRSSSELFKHWPAGFMLAYP